MITIEIMDKIYKNPPELSVRKLIVASLNKLLPRYGITTPLREAHFIAQCLHETGDFNFLIENMNYSPQGMANTWPGRFCITGKSGGAPNDIANKLGRNPIAIANYVYASRYGNGSVESGDGHRYRGRGAFHLTFKDNYRAFGDHIGYDLVSHPEDVQGIDLAIWSACWYWDNRNCNAAADSDNVTAVTKLVNGGNIGLDSRIKILARVKSAMGI